MGFGVEDNAVEVECGGVGREEEVDTLLKPLFLTTLPPCRTGGRVRWRTRRKRPFLRRRGHDEARTN
jgi:hypothetical protein